MKKSNTTNFFDSYLTLGQLIRIIVFIAIIIAIAYYTSPWVGRKLEEMWSCIS